MATDLGEAFAALGQGRAADFKATSGDRRRYARDMMKQQLILSALAPVAQGLGSNVVNFINEPFRDAARDYYRTGAGKDLGAAIQAYQGMRSKFNGLSKKVEADGRGHLYFYDQNKQEAYDALDREYAVFGKDFKTNNRFEYAEAKAQLDDYLRDQSKIEYKEYQKEKEFWNSQRSNDEIAEIVRKRSPYASNIGEAGWQKVKSFFSGKSKEEIQKDSLEKLREELGFTEKFTTDLQKLHAAGSNYMLDVEKMGSAFDGELRSKFDNNLNRHKQNVKLREDYFDGNLTGIELNAYEAVQKTIPKDQLVSQGLMAEYINREVSNLLNIDLKDQRKIFAEKQKRTDEFNNDLIYFRDNYKGTKDVDKETGLLFETAYSLAQREVDKSIMNDRNFRKGLLGDGTGDKVKLQFMYEEAIETLAGKLIKDNISLLTETYEGLNPFASGEQRLVINIPDNMKAELNETVTTTLTGFNASKVVVLDPAKIPNAMKKLTDNIANLQTNDPKQKEQLVLKFLDEFKETYNKGVFDDTGEKVNSVITQETIDEIFAMVDIPITEQQTLTEEKPDKIEVIEEESLTDDLKETATDVSDFLLDSASDVVKWAKENPADAASVGLMLVPGLGWIGAGAVRATLGAVRGIKNINAAYKAGKFDKLKKFNPLDLISKPGSGRTIPLKANVNGKQVTVGVRNVGREFSASRTAAGIGATSLALRKATEGDDAVQDNVLGDVLDELNRVNMAENLSPSGGSLLELPSSRRNISENTTNKLTDGQSLFPEGVGTGFEFLSNAENKLVLGSGNKPIPKKVTTKILKQYDLFPDNVGTGFEFLSTNENRLLLNVNNKPVPKKVFDKVLKEYDLFPKKVGTGFEFLSTNENRLLLNVDNKPVPRKIVTRVLEQYDLFPDNVGTGFEFLSDNENRLILTGKENKKVPKKVVDKVLINLFPEGVGTGFEFLSPSASRLSLLQQPIETRDINIRTRGQRKRQEIKDTGLTLAEGKDKKTLGIKNKNPLNIRDSKANDWKGLAHKAGAKGNNYAAFDNAMFGYRAADEILKTYNEDNGIDTIEGIISRFAPEKDNNDTEAYISFVSKRTGYAPDFNLNMRNDKVRAELLSAMARFESDVDVSDTTILSLIARANKI